MPNDPETPSRARRPWLVRAYPAPWRWLTGGLVGLSRASLPAIAGLVLVRRSERFELPTLLASLAAWAALPGAAAWLIERAFTARAELREGALHVPGAACISRFRSLRSRAPSPGACRSRASGWGCACARGRRCARASRLRI